MVRNSIQISGVYSLSEAAILQVHRSVRFISDRAHENNESAPKDFDMLHVPDRLQNSSDVGNGLLSP
jgi:hypothetical protein